jgi:hypothetical protein
MSGVPSAASLDKNWEIDKIHSNTEAIMEATPVTEPVAAATRLAARDQRGRDRGDPFAPH